MGFSLIGTPMLIILIALVIGVLVGIVKKNKRLFKTIQDLFYNFIGGHYNLYNYTFNFK